MTSLMSHPRVEQVLVLLVCLLLCVDSATSTPRLRSHRKPYKYYDDDTDDDDGVTPARPSYDHQTTTYTSQFEPLRMPELNTAAVAPFFSPDWSIQTLTQFIQEVPDNGYLHIGEPGWDSWIGCTTTQHEGNESCVGCDVKKLKSETFSLFPALLNARRRGVAVKLLTNDYGTPTCQSQIAPLDYLALNGVEIRTYTTTTFWHAKYMNSNGTKTAISSVNFSQASFMKNREAGFIIAGNGTEPLRNFTEAVFLHDWKQATTYEVNQTYTKEEMKIITDPSMLPVKLPSPPNYPGSYITPKPKFINSTMDLEIFTSPDYARPTLFDDLDEAADSFVLFIYQITDMNMCHTLLDRHNSGINVTILVSDRIYSYKDYFKAKKCYELLSKNKFDVRVTPSYYEFSHQKYWIVDGEKLGLSTGNWSPSDFPLDTAGSHMYPPYGHAGWQPVNRDFNIKVRNPDIIKVFMDTFTNDYHRGGWW